MKNLFQQFEKPESSTRGAPFWAWNAALKPEELVRQIRIMKEMGFGGFFMHSRVGMNTPYLSDEWFTCIDACVKEAKKLGMNAWLYDEDRWPSGAAGGFVTKDPKYRQRELICTRFSDDPTVRKGDIFFALTYGQNGACQYKRISDPKRYLKKAGHEVYRFRVRQRALSSWYNGQTYLDTLNPDAVKKFIEVTHEQYRKRFHRQFGKVIPGIFSDEPQFCSICGASWTDSLPLRFRKKYGYDICDHLPELFFDCGKKISAVRWNYRDLLTDLFVHSFVKQIGDWCGKNAIRMTGHVMNEDSLLWQTFAVGSAMRSYEYMQMPGIDLLTELWQVFNTAKQCASAARQCGKVHRLSETYGCTGWDFPFMGHKTLGDWQYALGINFRCQHLAWYSMEAEAKRDYPASISFQSSWYKKYNLIEDYFARLGTVMTGGKEIRDILVIHPVESYWSMYYPDSTSSDLTELDRAFAELTSRLLALNIDFDFGDEEMMSRLAKADGRVFKVGEASYKAILIPELKCIRSTTLKLLKAWAKTGGTVVYLGTPPEYVDAKESDEAKQIYENFENGDISYLDEKLLKDGRRLSVADRSGSQIEPVLSRLAEKDDAYNLFLCNTGMTFGNACHNCMKMVRDRNLSFPYAKITVALPENGSVYELDPFTGKVYATDYLYENGCYVIETSFAPLQSHLYLITKKVPADIAEAPVFHEERLLGTFPENHWKFQLSDHNTLVLDHFDLRVNGENELKNEYVLTADNHLRKMLGVQPRGGQMVQPWLLDKSTPKKQLNIELNYTFACEKLPEKLCLLAVERPELYSKILFNGKPLNLNTESWWVDPVLKTLELPCKTFRTGANTLQFLGKYHEKLPGLEAVFVLGDFGVVNEKMTTLPAELNTGDWGPQGLMEYSGDVSYRQQMTLHPKKDQHVFLRIPAWRGAAIGITVNRSDEQMVILPPFELDITPYLKNGKNDFCIRVYGSRRNAFGPFFAGQKWQQWVGPGQFVKMSPVRQLVPCGLLAQPEFLIRQ